MTDLLHALADQLAAAIEPGRTGGFRWFERPYAELPPSTWASMASNVQSSYRVQVLADHLYVHLYCHGMLIEDLNEMTVRDDGQADIDQLVEIGANRFAPDAGWQVLRVDRDEVLVERNGLRARVPGAWIDRSEDGDVVRTPVAEPRTSPGFVLFRGSSDVAGIDLCRFYLSLDGPARLACVAALLPELDRRSIPFRLKTIAHPDQRHRADSVVLYVDGVWASATNEAVRSTRSAWGRGVIDVVPTFSRRLDAGLGFARDPGGGRSFGEHRCKAVAVAIDRWSKSSETLRDLIIDSFNEAGIDTERTYLGIGDDDLVVNLADAEAPSARDAEHEVSVIDRAESRGAHNPATRAASSDDPLVGATGRIADLLVDRAVRHNGRATWIGVSPAPGGPLARTLGADLYHGTAGIALALARIGSALGEDRWAATSIEAARQSLATMSETPGEGGWWSGRAGVIGAALEVGRLHDPELVTQTIERVGSSIGASVGPPDLLIGASGELIGMVRLARQVPGPLRDACAARAHALATHLRETATPTEGDDAGIGWFVEHEGEPRRLAGFSHGGAGVAAAMICYLAYLAEVGESTNAALDAYGQVAGAALVGDDSLFDPVARNWIDARSPSAASTRLSNAWCHGRPGELTARHLVGDRVTVAEPPGATTDEMIESLRSDVLNGDPTRQISLCHGLIGNSEILRRLVPADEPVIAERLRRLVTELGDNVATWPHGLRAGFNPSLMTGLAGIGLGLAGFASNRVLTDGVLFP